MTDDELREFLREHKKLHPDFAKWSTEVEPESKAAIHSAWSATLADVTLAAATDVSRGLLDGTIEPLEGWKFNRDFNLLGGFVRKHAKQQQPFRLSTACNRTGRELTYHCRYCRDTGHRDVFHPNAIDAVVSGRADPKSQAHARRLSICVVLCDCEAGRGIKSAQAKHWSDHQVFDPNHHCECPMGDKVKYAPDLVSWIAAKQDIANHPGYRSEFAAYNGE